MIKIKNYFQKIIQKNIDKIQLRKNQTKGRWKVAFCRKLRKYHNYNKKFK